MYKVLYTINLLPCIGTYVSTDPATGKKSIVNDHIDFTNLIAELEEVEINRAEFIVELVKYKWDK